MAAIGTFYSTGPTDFGQDADHRSNPDHIFAPSSALEACVSCCIMRSAMRDLQKIPHALPRDRCPPLWRLRYKLHFDEPPPSRETLDP
eukprot:644114-Pyramimonas_sp.AAC.1